MGKRIKPMKVFNVRIWKLCWKSFELANYEEEDTSAKVKWTKASAQ